MSKLLMLNRHAEAVDRALSDSDKNRELTSKGVTQAHQMGVYLSNQMLSPDAIFSSTAARASQTATLIADAMKFPSQQIIFEDELYDASVRTFYQFISNLDDEHSRVLCIGHNPTISYLAEYITKQSIGEMSPSGVVVIRFDMHTWKDLRDGAGEFVRYIDPLTISQS